MEAQDFVFDRYPNAVARREPAIVKHGATTPIEHGYWGIFSGPDFDADELGHGSCEAKAWSDAARRLEGRAA